VTTTRRAFNAVLLRQLPFAEAAQRGEVTFTGNAARFTELLALFDDADPAFKIVEPRTP
jgi:alkyl sulfatase BDS1-like metallo-beta-lactamase superfamily hydrolase